MDINLPGVIQILGKTDVYLLDQVMKGRYQPTDKILDAGCGYGRNVDLFYQVGMEVSGVDLDPKKIQFCQEKYPEIATHFTTQDLASVSFSKETFDHVISSAVLHFCESLDQFKMMFSEHVRVLKKSGTLFVRMTSLFGIPTTNVSSIGEGVYQISNYGTRFLITYELISELLDQFELTLLEPIKTVNVQDNRAMAVLMFQKK